MMITSKMWPLEHQQDFPLIWPGELVFDIKWPSFKLDLEIIKTNILSNIYDDYQGSRGRRILRPGTHKSGSGLLKIPKAESAGRMFFPVGLLLIMVGLSDWSIKSAACYSYRR